MSFQNGQAADLSAIYDNLAAGSFLRDDLELGSNPTQNDNSRKRVANDAPFTAAPLEKGDPATASFSKKAEGRRDARIVAHGYVTKEFVIYEDNTSFQTGHYGAVRWNRTDNVDIATPDVTVKLTETFQDIGPK
jgi:hypothetical protein